MKQRLLLTSLVAYLFAFFLTLGNVVAQTTSTNTVDYKVTYDPAAQEYTVWVVPNYSTPNTNNSSSTERGATAQVTLEVPTGFNITSVTNVVGTWNVSGVKFGPAEQTQLQNQGLTAGRSYYVIGKDPSETNYGQFTSGTPVALFKFKGNGCFGMVEVITKTDPIIAAADTQLSFNVAPSFYSNSGQPAGGNQDPLEQYNAPSGAGANCFDAVNDTYTATSGTPAVQNVLSNDTFNGAPVSPTAVNITVPSQPTNGTVSVNTTTGEITYTPNPGFSGTDTYTYQICDKLNPTVCETATVTITTACPTVAAPTASNPSAYCQGATASPLTATAPTGSTLRWYGTSATGGTFTTTAPTPSTTASGTTTYYVASFNTASGCESTARTAITVTVNAAPTAPTATSPVTYCQGATATALSATAPAGSTLLWYTTATGGTGSTTAPTPSTTTAGTTAYYVTSVNSTTGCESLTRTQIDVIVNAAPVAPTASPSTVTYCQGAVANPLTASAATGSTLRWYTVATGGTGSATAPTPSTATAGTTSYYVTSVNTTTGCESLTRTKIDVVVNPAPTAPTATTPVTYCQGATATALTATPAAGSTLSWYTTATGGTGTSAAPTPSTTTAGTTSYYVTSVNSTTGCESLTRTKIDVIVNAAPAAPTATTPVTYCQNATATALTATAPAGSDLFWYTSSTATVGSSTAPTPSTTTVGTTAYYVTAVNSTTGCESLTRTQIDVIVNAAPSAPVATSSTVTYCQGATATALSANSAAGTSLRWYTTATGGTASVVAPTPSTTTAGTTSYYVTSVNNGSGCESLTRTKIDVVVNPAPVAPTATTPVTYCQNATASPLTASSAAGTTLNWYTTATGGTPSGSAPTPSTATAGTTSYYVTAINTTTGCESLTRTKIDVVVNPAPSAPTATSPVTYCQNATASPLTATAASGSTLKWYTSSTATTGTTVAPTPSTTTVGTTSYYVTSVNSTTGCESLTRTQIDVVVNAAPTAPVATSSTVTYCEGATATALSASSGAGTSLRWYTVATGGTASVVAPTPATTPAGTTSYYVTSVNSTTGCESLTRTQIDVVVNAAPTAPTATTPVTYCQNATATALTATAPAGSTLRWYGTAATGGTPSATAPTPSTATPGTTSYYVAAVNTTTGCESLTRTKIDVVVNAAAAAPTATSPVVYCQNATATALTATAPAGSTLRWYGTSATGGTASTTAPTPSTTTVGTTSYYVSAVTTANGCESLTRTKIDVTVNVCRVVYAFNDANTTPVNTTIAGSVLTNDDLNNGATALVVSTSPVASPTNGTVTLNANGTYSYTPAPNFVGTDSFKYRVCDQGTPAACDTATVFIDVYAAPSITANDKPLAMSDVASTTKGTPVSGNVIANDIDPDSGQTLTATKTSDPTNGTITFNPDGTYTYTPNPGFVGEDSFTYQVCDNGTPQLCDNATVQLVVKDTPVAGTNLPPVAVDDQLTTPSGVPATGSLLTNDKDPEGGTLTINTTPTVPPTNGTVTINPDGTYSYTPTPGFVGTDSFVYTVCDNGTPQKCSKATVYVQVSAGKVSILPKAYLQGALFGVVSPNTLMRDDLRVKNLIPLSSPYPGLGFTEISPTTATTAAVLAVTGNNAIVDWVFVELRSATASNTVVDSRSALIQRDGDIVDVDGVTPLTFSSAQPASYFVAVKHRNHLGVMTKTALPLSAATSTIDFRQSSTPTYTLSTSVIDQAQVVVQQGVAMWAGNSLYDNKVIYQGTSNDVNAIYQTIIASPSNVLVTPFFKLKTYSRGDINMNGEVVFQGTGNDVEYIYLNVIKNHPGNTLKQNNFIIKEQLPL